MNFPWSFMAVNSVRDADIMKTSTFLHSHYEPFRGETERLANNADQNGNQFKGAADKAQHNHILKYFILPSI